MTDWTELDKKLEKGQTNDPWAALDAKLGPAPEKEKAEEPKVAASPAPKDTPLTSGFFGQNALFGAGGIGDFLRNAFFASHPKIPTNFSFNKEAAPVQNALVSSGVVSPENANPTGTVPKLVAAGERGLVGQLPIAAMTGGSATLLGLAKLAAQGVSSGVGGEIGNEVGGQLGGLVGSFVGGAAPNVAEVTAAKLAGAPASYLPLQTPQVNPQAAGPLQGLMNSGVEPSLNQFFPKMKRSLTQSEQFAQGLAKSFGEDATDLKPDTFSNAAKRIGASFDDVAAKTGTIPLDVDYALEHYGIQQRLANSALSDSEKGAIQRMLDNVSPNSNPSITGKQYQQYTQSGGQLSDLLGNDNSTVKGLAQNIRGALDNAMERAAPPDVVDQLRQARVQYKNMLMTKDFKPDAQGFVDPGSITTSRVSNYYPNYFKGGMSAQDDLENILRGASLLKTPEQGSSGLNTLLNLSKPGIAGAAGGLAAEHLIPSLTSSNPNLLVAGLGGAGVGYGSQLLSKAILNSDWYKSQLLKQALGQTPTYNPLISSAASYEANQ